MKEKSEKNSFKDFESKNVRESIQSNIPQQFIVITNLPVFICKFETLEKQIAFDILKKNFAQYSQNENYFDQFIQKRKNSLYLKELNDLKNEASEKNL